MKKTYMMKTVSLFLLICLILLQPANILAVGNYATLEDIKQEAMKGWHQSYEAHGRTIAIDVSTIKIPKVQQVPVYKLSSAGPVADDLLAGLNVVNNAGFLNAAAGNLWGETYKARYVDYKINEYFTLENARWEMRTDGSEMTLQDAYDFSYALIHRIYGEELAGTLQLEGIHVLGKIYAIKPEDHSLQDALTQNGSYTFHYRQYLGAIPIFQGDGPVFEKAVKNEPYLDISCSAETEVFSTQDYALFGGIARIQETLHEDIPLSPIGTLIAVLEDEISAGRLRAVESIELGYLIYHDKTSLDIGWAIPTWKCVAEYYVDETGAPYTSLEADGTVSTIPRISPIYIPAQNPYLDLFSVDSARKTAPSIMTWEQAR
ncbi:MAG: hypothetical protein GX096_02365 [Clostridiales bacterium]|nr:hypothetical protein [Clostridiales bacterium]